MQGFLVTFYTQQSRRHVGVPLANWIVAQAQELGVRGATLTAAKEGVGHDGRFHSDNYFDQEDPPQQVSMALTPDECQRMLARLAHNGLRVFYTKTHIEFGYTCAD